VQRFFVTPGAVMAGAVEFTPEQARQMAAVLRLRPGATVVALDGMGWAYRVVLREVTPHRAAGDIIERQPARGEPATRITLYQGVTRSARWEVVLQKGTETGVAAFVPVRCRRSVAGGDGSPDRMTRWRQIVQEAAEQSGRGRLPEVSAAVPFEAAIAAANGVPLLLHPWGKTVPLRVAATLTTPGAGIALFVGPEGGFDDGEVAAAVTGGLVPVHLGSRILRTETAGPLAAALLLQELDDLGGPPVTPG